jgi:hypothetical protein
MRWSACLLAVLFVPALAAPAQAVWPFGKKKQGNPAEQVSELIATIKNAREDRKRELAVEDLRHFDGAAFPQIAPLLIEVLKGDPSTTVRVEAARSLGRLRPATPEAARALETAADQDSSFRVRLQSRAAMTFYSAPPVKGKDEPKAATGEPPLAGEGPALPPPQPIGQVSAKGPLLPPIPDPTAPQQQPVERPLPRGPAWVPARTPTNPPRPTPPPPAVVPDEGPILLPPP